MTLALTTIAKTLPIREMLLWPRMAETEGEAATVTVTVTVTVTDGSGGGGGGNSADPAINQAQSNVQNVQCVSGGGIDDSCFNYNSQNLANKGNVAVAQDGGNGRGSGNGDGDGDDGSGGGGGGNSADPAINQAQSNVQNVQCVSGKDAIVSCNNVSFQNQINEGNIALGQIY